MNSVQPQISVIVPVFNSEKYLENCLLSIQNQTFNSFECILVNDGSTDSSLQICEKFRDMDKRFHILSIKNSGPAGARNAGLNEARGRYTGFADSDDFLDPEMLSTMFSDIQIHKADVVICTVHGQKTNIETGVISWQEAVRQTFSPKGFHGFSVTKLIRTDLLKELRFDEDIRYMEDVLFFYRLFPKAERIFFHNIPLYHYVQHPSSITNRYGLTEEAETAVIMLKKLITEEKDKKILKTIHSCLNSFIVALASGYVLNSDICEKFLTLKSDIRQKFLKIMTDSSISWQTKVWTVIICLYRNYDKSCVIRKIRERDKRKKSCRS